MASLMLGQHTFPSFFFDFKDIGKQDTRAVFSYLIVQLSNQSQSFYHVFDCYSTHHKGSQQPSIGALTKCLEDMLKATGKCQST